MSVDLAEPDNFEIRQLAKRALQADIGTWHTFQGREVSVLVFDLMQNSQARWVSLADIDRGERALSAAKLLNVAITRVQERIYLFGNWSYVRRARSPGMRALAILQGRDSFRLIPARELLAGSLALER